MVPHVAVLTHPAWEGDAVFNVSTSLFYRQTGGLGNSGLAQHPDIQNSLRTLPSLINHGHLSEQCVGWQFKREEKMTGNRPIVNEWFFIDA